MRIAVLALVAAGMAVTGAALAQSSNPGCTSKCARTYASCVKSCGAGVAGGACETRCSNAQDACMAKCASSGEAYQTCIKAAKTPAERQKCIDQYHSDWGTGKSKTAK